MILVDKNFTEKEQLMFYYGMYLKVYKSTCNFSYLEVYGQSMQVHGVPPLKCSFSFGQSKKNSTQSQQQKYKVDINEQF